MENKEKVFFLLIILLINYDTLLIKFSKNYIPKYQTLDQHFRHVHNIRTIFLHQSIARKVIGKINGAKVRQWEILLTSSV